MNHHKAKGMGQVTREEIREMMTPNLGKNKAMQIIQNGVPSKNSRALKPLRR
jgi:hypothetical protein